VALDRGGAGAAAGLDHIRVEGALHEEVDVAVGLDRPGLLLEDPDELAADRLALGLRVGDAGERIEEALARIRDPELNTCTSNEVTLDLLGLALAQQAVVHEHAGELITDGPLDESGSDCRVDASGEAADHPA